MVSKDNLCPFYVTNSDFVSDFGIIYPTIPDGVLSLCFSTKIFLACFQHFSKRFSLSIFHFFSTFIFIPGRTTAKNLFVSTVPSYFHQLDLMGIFFITIFSMSLVDVLPHLCDSPSLFTLLKFTQVQFALAMHARLSRFVPTTGCCLSFPSLSF